MKFSIAQARLVRRTVLAAAVAVTLVAAAYLEEDWRGARAWTTYLASEAQGRIYGAQTPSAVQPAPELNFMCSPVLAGVLFQSYDKATVRDYLRQLPVGFSDSTPWVEGRSLDLAAFVAAQRKARPGDVAAGSLGSTPTLAALELLKGSQVILAPLRNALATRPVSSVVKDSGTEHRLKGSEESPNFDLLVSLMQTLDVDACANLAAGRSEVALEDSLACLRLSRGLLNARDVTLLDTLVGDYGVSLSLQPVWEGIRRHAWTDGQLVRLQHELDRVDELGSLTRSIVVARQKLMVVMDDPTLMEAYFAPHRPGKRRSPRWTMLGLLPRGWAQQAKIGISECVRTEIEMLRASNTPDFFARRNEMKASDRAFVVRAKYNPYARVAVPMLENFERITQLAAVDSVDVALARTACALERYRLAAGAYPDSLVRLVPEYLPAVPKDVVNGRPLRYRTQSAGDYLLYSVGIDGVDNDGEQGAASMRRVLARGDLAWPLMHK
ncbi:hypothetical protein GALL_96170 [mine drainage metagenome]|uniref:Bacterial type II secretion system protein G n=1 Tax=mine drainage metagenome TaxID=410659 RepID=A0A1J5T7L6_9ZZZZ